MDGRNDYGRMVNALTNNARDLALELDWLSIVIDTRLSLYFAKESTYKSIYEIQAPDFSQSQSVYANFVNHYGCTLEERLIIAIATAPMIKPEILDVFFTQNATFNRGFTEFGGVKGAHHGGFIPTIETALFLLAENNLGNRFQLQDVFSGEHYFGRDDILLTDAVAVNEPWTCGAIRLSKEYQELFTKGTARKPNFSKSFPAKLITTQLEWGDLILPSKTLAQIEELKIWIDNEKVLMQDWNLQPKLRPGHRGIFYGPPGTGKTMSACLLGKLTGRDVYRIDLSMVVSKYIGETEENLAKVFDQAENKNWILFFDEADALFGSRVKTESSNDMFANQQVSYLLQRIEDFNGVIVLSTNLKSNMDTAFLRRFESIIYFKVPDVKEREILWQKGFSDQSQLEEKISIPELAEKYELTGATIMNIVRFASLMAIKRKSTIIQLKDIQIAVRREYSKEGKTV